MKRLLLFSVVLYGLVLTSPCASQTYKLDVKTIWSNFDNPEVWQQDYVEQYTYGNGGNKETKILGLVYPSLENDYQYIKTYNTTNNTITTNLRQDWNGASWDDSYQETYTYYTGTSNIKDITTYSFEAGFDVLKISYEYIGADVYKITFQEGSTGTLVNYRQFEYAYGTSGQPSTEWERQWTGSAWQLIERGTATYTTNQRELIVDSYNGSTYTLKERYITTYMGTLETIYLWQSWVDPNWVNEDREVSTYDSNGNKELYVYQDYDSATLSWVGYYKEESSFSLAAPLSTESFDNNNFKIYPNPASSVIYISSNSSIGLVTIYDVLGNQVLKTKNTKQINVESLKTGVYILKAYNEKSSTTKRVVIR
ncbi:T9SS type A sorting domain-containing protein [Mariniflexile aquimaris]|uniref:T9SS type A sorting domain-containing protein n=1 Tax=Mariniflexile aquimaris TaxID=881009 RepID=A0ABW3BU18_9FLAO